MSYEKFIDINMFGFEALKFQNNKYCNTGKLRKMVEVGKTSYHLRRNFIFKQLFLQGKDEPIKVISAN